MGNYVKLLSNGQEINLDDLSLEELYKLHYEEEILAVAEAKKRPPFSVERYEILCELYTLVHKIMNLCVIKETGSPKESFGASKLSVNILIKLIDIRFKTHKTQKITLYEAGVGSGYAINRVLDYCKRKSSHAASNIDIKGCDLDISDNVSDLVNNNCNVEVQKGNLYECIQKQPDNSIDVFYADNVFEHLFPDEIEVIISEIKKKLKPGAFVYLIIPHIFTGPHDISGRFLTAGEKAIGTHFLEMSFNDITRYMSSAGIQNEYCVVSLPKSPKLYLVKSRILTKLKLKFEYIIPKIPNNYIKTHIFIYGSYSYSVMKSNGPSSKPRCP